MWTDHQGGCPGLWGWREGRHLGLSGAELWTRGGTFGLDIGDHLEDQLMKRTQKFRKGEALRPQPGAPTQRYCGDR